MVAISVEASAIGIQLLIICLIEIKKWASALSYFTQTANEKISRLRILLIIQDLWTAMCLFTLAVGFRCTPTETEINSPVFPKCNQTNFDLNRLPLKTAAHFICRMWRNCKPEIGLRFDLFNSVYACSFTICRRKYTIKCHAYFCCIATPSSDNLDS